MGKIGLISRTLASGYTFLLLTVAGLHYYLTLFKGNFIAMLITCILTIAMVWDLDLKFHSLNKLKELEEAKKK